MVGLDEPAHREALSDHEGQVARRSWRLCRVVLRDGATHRDAPVEVEGRDGRLEVVAAHVVEVHVDTVGRRVLELTTHVAVLVVERRVEAALLGALHLLRRTGRTDDARRALELRDLPHERTDGTRRARDEDRVARLELGRAQQAAVRGDARHAQHAEVRGRRDLDAVDLPLHLARALRRDDREVAPAETVQHEVPRGEPVSLRLDDLTDRATVERLVDLERRNVRLHVVHAPTHVRVDAHHDVAHEQLTVTERGQFALLETEVVGRRSTLRARRENDDAGLVESHALTMSHTPDNPLAAWRKMEP